MISLASCISRTTHKVVKLLVPVLELASNRIGFSLAYKIGSPFLVLQTPLVVACKYLPPSHHEEMLFLHLIVQDVNFMQLLSPEQL
jgi:hypothetical protein